MSKPVKFDGFSAVSAVLKVAAISVVVLAAACTPTVKIATDEPITINLNVNIKHEILVKVDKELDDIFSSDSELF
ncbi:MAG: YnbE family lipoprotein [Pseudomonadales bacterium]